MFIGTVGVSGAKMMMQGFAWQTLHVFNFF